LKTEEESWNTRRRCSALEPHETTRSYVMVFFSWNYFPFWSAAMDASCGTGISNYAATDSVAQLLVSSLCTTATAKEQQCTES
jgi:hypothetical protein